MTGYIQGEYIYACFNHLDGSSVTVYLHKVMLDVLDGANDGLYSAMCFYDLSKCFDTIDHDILLLK